MEPLHTDIQTKIIEFIFREVVRREAQQWLGATRKSRTSEYSTSALLMQLERWQIPLDQKTCARLRGIDSIEALLAHYLLKGVRLDSHMGLWGLVAGRYPLRLRHDIPSPEEMLECQCRGERYVTYLDGPEHLNRPVGRFAGSYEFLMHDLEHANKFFGDPELFRGQVNFFNLLKNILPILSEWMGDELFVKDLNYLKSDMNSHPVHLFKYLKAIVLTAQLRRGGEEQQKLDFLWNQILQTWRAPNNIRAAALRINRPGLETPEDQLLIHDFFRRTMLEDRHA